jgi:signal peptidase
MTGINDVNWRRIGNAAGLLVLIAVVVPFAVTAVPQLALADQSYVVRSDSMSPSIQAGDVVIVDDVSADAIAAEDVIAFHRGDRVTTHRVVEVVERDGSVQFRTKGDANEEPDSQLVAPDAVVGRVSVTIPQIGHVVAFTQTRLGLFVFVVVPAIALALNEFWTIGRARSQGGSE